MKKKLRRTQNKRTTLPEKKKQTLPAQNNSGSFVGNAAGAIGTGLGFGVGSSIGHAVFDKAFSDKQENTQSNDMCEKLVNDFQKCIEDSKNHNFDNYNVCNQYIEMMKNMNCGN